LGVLVYGKLPGIRLVMSSTADLVSAGVRNQPDVSQPPVVGFRCGKVENVGGRMRRMKKRGPNVLFDLNDLLFFLTLSEAISQRKIHQNAFAALPGCWESLSRLLVGWREIHPIHSTPLLDAFGVSISSVFDASTRLPATRHTLPVLLY